MFASALAIATLGTRAAHVVLFRPVAVRPHRAQPEHATHRLVKSGDATGTPRMMRQGWHGRTLLFRKIILLPANQTSD